MDPHSPKNFIATNYCFLILGDDTSFFFFLSLFLYFSFLCSVMLCYLFCYYKFLQKLFSIYCSFCYLLFLLLFNELINYFFIKKIYFNFFMFRDVPGCSGMFRNVPRCSMFRVLSTPAATARKVIDPLLV